MFDDASSGTFVPAKPVKSRPKSAGPTVAKRNMHPSRSSRPNEETPVEYTIGGKASPNSIFRHVLMVILNN